MPDDKDSISVTPAILSLAMALQTAAEAYRAESILARHLKLPELPGFHQRCEILFGQYAKSMLDQGIVQNRATFMALLEAKVPEALLEVPFPELPSKWRFSPAQGWTAVELVPA